MATTFREGIPKNDFRIDVSLNGVIDGVNQIFTLPDLGVQDPPSSRITVYYNGVRQSEGNDFALSTSSGPLTADTVSFFFAPLPGDKITADYIVST
jgi:hypothetical protein